MGRARRQAPRSWGWPRSRSALGRRPWGVSGQSGLWSGDIHSPHNSQYLADPYSFTHVTHWIPLYGLVWLIGGRLPQSQLLDAVAVGQVTPGPVFTTATFIGYLLGGTTGAIVATLGIFIPSFILVAASRPLIPRIRRSMIAGAFLDGVDVGALALMAAVTLQLSRAALVDVTTGVVAAISALLLIYSRVNSAWLIFAAGLVGFTLTQWSGG